LLSVAAVLGHQGVLLLQGVVSGSHLGQILSQMGSWMPLLEDVNLVFSYRRRSWVQSLREVHTFVLLLGGWLAPAALFVPARLWCLLSLTLSTIDEVIFLLKKRFLVNLIRAYKSV
jgi:hypothetical protein